MYDPTIYQPEPTPTVQFDEDGDMVNPPDPEPVDDEDDDEINAGDSFEEEEDSLEIKKGTTLYLINKERTFDEEKAPDVIKLYTTVAQCERDVLEYWKDQFMLTYEVQESFYAISADPIDEDEWLYAELDIPEHCEEITIPKEDMENLKLIDTYPLTVEYITKRLQIEERRFVRLEKGTMIYSANKSAIPDPQPRDDEVGCYFYTTMLLPEETVLDDWEDKILNTYYFNRNVVLPYGADNERDEYFHDRYEDVVVVDDESSDDGSGEHTITSYYDDTVSGEYLEPDEGSAEIFLVEKDLEWITYYGSHELKLDTVKFIHSVKERKI